MKDLPTQKVAIVHDWLVGGGAEKVVLELHRLFPDAPIYTSYCSDEWRARLDNKVITGYLQTWPFAKLRKFLPLLRMRWFAGLDLSEYDLVISSSGNGEAKHVQTKDSATHICYCHSPTHFYWRHYDQYMTNPGFGLFNPLARMGLRILVKPLRKRDEKAAQNPDFLIANSTHIQSDIKQYYGRESTVIHPPVDTDRFRPSRTVKRSGFVTLGRQTPYKRTDLIVDACTELDLPLTVIGNGPEHDSLVKRAGKNVRFITDASDADLPVLLASAKAFIFAAHEDFGVTPVEALAAGTPVIAYRAGGALDYVKQDINGTYFDEQTVDSLEQSLQSFKATDFTSATVAATANDFSIKKFHDTFMKYLQNHTK